MRLRRFVCMLLALVFLAATVPAPVLAASYETTGYEDMEEGVTGGTITADLILVRPLGIIGTALGIGVFIASLPFSIPTGSAGRAADKLVAEPFKFTFARPIGELNQ